MQVTEETEFIAKEFAKLVGKILTLCEAVIVEPKQCEATKRSMEVAIYDTRNIIMSQLGRMEL